MSFIDQLSQWVRRAIGPELKRNINRLIDRRLRRRLPVVVRGPVLGSRGSAGLATVIVPESPPSEGRFLYYPLSDDAPYGWGDPYEDPPGVPVNPPLGTVLARRQCDVLAWTHDGSKHPFRAYDPDAVPQVEHGTNLKAGRFYWKYGDYVITWAPPIGIETYGDSNIFGEERAVYRNGGILAYGPKSGSSPFEIKAAAIKKIGQTVYIYVCLSASLNYILQRAVIDPVGTDQVLTWEISTGMASVFSGVTPPYQTGINFLLSACFNKSCTRLIINQPGRVFEIDIANWNGESLLNENYYWNNYVWLAGDPEGGDIQESDIETPVVSGYTADSDTRRDLTIKIESRRDANLPGMNASWKAFARLDGVTMKEVLLTGGYRYGANAIRFMYMHPQFQDIQSGVFILETHTLDSEDDPLVEEPGYDLAVCTREFTTEVYQELQLHSRLDVTETHPVAPCTGPPTVGHNPELFVWANNHPLRESAYYGGGAKNYRFEFPFGNWFRIDNDRAMAFAVGETIGVLFDDPTDGGPHVVVNHRPVQWGIEEPFVNYFQPHNYTAFAANWDGAFFLSARRFQQWQSSGVPVFQWWNTGTTDFVDKTQIVGQNPRFLSRPCSVKGQGEVKPPNQHVGILHVSEANPFA